MALVKGPFNFKWGTQQINNVSEISVDYSVDTSDTTTLDGNRFTVQTGMGMSVTLTVLDNDVATLATLLPQYYNSADGTVDIAAASCDVIEEYNDLEITSCGSGAQMLRLNRARTQVDSIDIGDGLRTVAIMFVGEPLAGDPLVQFAAAPSVS